MYIRGGFRSESSSEKLDMVVLLIIIFTIILVGYYTATYNTITDTDKAVCIEKRVSKDSVTFRFKRDRDSEEFQYTINETECGKKDFNELNERIKEDTICVIETNNLDAIRHVSVSDDG